MKMFMNLFKDTSLDNFMTTLYDCIICDNVQNSYHCFKFKLNKKNALYKAIEYYRDDGVKFYSKFLSEHPEIIIKRIGDIHMGELCDFKNQAAFPNQTYYLNFTVYYEKHTT